MYKVPENELTLKAVRKAIFKIAESVYFNTNTKNLEPRFQKMCMVEFAEYFANEYAEDIYEVAKRSMFPISNFSYYSSDNQHIVAGQQLFDRKAFNIMTLGTGSSVIKQAPSSEIHDTPALFEEILLYMLDDGTVYVVDSMYANLGNNTDVKYRKVRNELHSQFSGITLEMFQTWLLINRRRLEHFDD